MQVYSPASATLDNEEAQAYCYRIRKIINRNGAEFTQVCSTGATAGEWTFGSWNKSMRTNHIAVSPSYSTGTKIGTITVDGSQKTLYAPVQDSRFLVQTIPAGTKITASETAQVNLNSIEYMKVGLYYCSQTAQTDYIKNIPTKSAFLMQVYSPLSPTVDNEETGTWVYRIRKFTSYAGAEYTQSCYSTDVPGEWVYGPWHKTMKRNHFEVIPEFNTGIKIAGIKIDDYNPINIFIPDQASNDGNNNNIVETYETKTDAVEKLNTATAYVDNEINTLSLSMANDILALEGSFNEQLQEQLNEAKQYVDDNKYVHPAYDALAHEGPFQTTLDYGQNFTIQLPITDNMGHLTDVQSMQYTLPTDRFFGTIAAAGTALTSSDSAPLDLNTVTYLKVGNYYCSNDTQVKTMKNCPSTSAFKLEVISPVNPTVDNETTKTYQYRIRRLINRSGAEYISVCSSGATAGTWTYGAWNKVIRSNHLAAKANYTSGTEIGYVTFDGKQTKFFVPIPDFSTATEGSVLKIVNGSPAWVAE